jgi:NAD(P)-dependent dehydrogenase (short-subunit alcohol dehydrogenase family)
MRMKNIVVIGGNKGVGYEIVKVCLEKGYRVAVSCKEPVTSFPIQGNDSILVRSFDLEDTNKCIQFIEEVISVWHKIDGVVFYAGITPVSPLTDCAEDLYDQIFDINLKSTFFITQTTIKNMIENRCGSFVFFGTSHMESGQIDRAAYAISKGGLKTLSNHLARRYAKYQVRSNIIVMGWTPTEGELALRAYLGVSREELVAEASEYVPMGRMLTVNDPVPAVMYFLSDESAMVTGSTIRVNGGEYI